MIEVCRTQPERILADDEIGFVAYVGDMNIFSVSGLGNPANRLIVHAAANAQRAVDLILGSTFGEENETTKNVGDADDSGIPTAVAMTISPASYGHAHL